MHCTQIQTQPEIYEIRVPFTNLNTNATNCYVVRDGDEALVIDVGAPSEEGGRILKDCLERLGIDLRKTSFFLTHFHLDHAGLADAVVPPEAKLYVSEAEYLRTRPEAARIHAHALKHRLAAIGASAEESDMVVVLEEEGSQFVSAPHDITFVTEGDRISVGDVELVVVDTSGHTAGHIALFEPASRCLFGGDHVLFVISPSIDYFGGGKDGLRTYLDNLAKLQALPVEKLLCAHGEFREDHRERIAWLLAHHRKRLDEVCGIAALQGELAGIDLIRSIAWNVPASSWEGISVLQRAIIITQGLVILDHLVFSGRLATFEGEDGMVRYRLEERSGA